MRTEIFDTIDGGVLCFTDKDEMAITDPTLDSSGRFSVNPMSEYGLSEEEASAILSHNHGLTDENTGVEFDWDGE